MYIPLNIVRSPFSSKFVKYNREWIAAGISEVEAYLNELLCSEQTGCYGGIYPLATVA